MPILASGITSPQNSVRAAKGRLLPLTAASGLMLWNRLTPFGTITLTLTAAPSCRVPLWAGLTRRVSELASGLTRNQEQVNVAAPDTVDADLAGLHRPCRATG